MALMQNKGVICVAENCDRPALAKCLCNAHYLRMKKGYETTTSIRRQEKGRTCSIDKCDKKHYGNGYCVSHWKIWNRKTIKSKLIEMMGGKCKACGGVFHIASYDFHHLDPKKKDFSITDKLQRLPFEKIKEEADKCILLCANCHRVEHSGELI